MDKTKAAVENFLHNKGHNDTTVHEKVAPAVTKETVQQTHHTEHQTAIDRERHQDHHHTTVQPVHDKQVLPEQHKHNVAAVDERHVHHGNESDIKARLEQERLQFKDTTHQGGTRQTESAAPTVEGEHVHHHVYETIQPVVEKETIQPSVVHDTIPVHEVHHHEAKHHTASALPGMSISEFQQQGGSLTGRAERTDGFEGEPRSVGNSLGSSALNSSHRGGASGAGPHDSSLANKGDPRVDSDLDGSRNAGMTQTRGGATGTGTGTGMTGGTTGTHGTTGTGTGVHNSSLGNKADPRVDSDYDGSRNAGLSSGTGTTGGVGSHAGTGVGGTHASSGVGGTHGSTTTGTGAGTGSGLNSTTSTDASSAPRHGSNLLNKLDPRVDANRDGKKGLGA